LTTSPELEHTTALRVAYLINEYPAVSHTFIKREIQALERRGVRVIRFALRSRQGELVDADDRRELEDTRYVLSGGLGVLAIAAARRAVLAPSQFLTALALTIRLSLDSDKSFARHLAYLAEACLLRQWLADEGVTHLHAHFATNPAEVALLVRTLGGPRYSFTAHGSDIADRPAQMALEYKVGHASFVAVVCSFGRNQIWRWVPFEMWGKVALIRCGLPPGYGADSTAMGEKPHRLVCVGRLSKEKGQALLIEATAQLRDSGVPVEVVLVGDGPMRAELERLVERHRLERHVRLVGFLDNDGTEKELCLARALVVSSLSEGLPVVIMEAMANRRPVIAPYLAGIPELVIQGESGWLYPPGDVNALKQAMKACLTATPDTLAALGDRAHDRVLSYHDADVEADKLLGLIRRSASTGAKE
jgi:colanic acid/amylovoran biosynthesis glycosyltransferase